MKFEQAAASSKDSQAEKAEAKQHTKDEIDKFNKMLLVFEKSNVDAGVQRENFKNLGLEDLYEKHLEKGKADGENTKAIERKKVLNSKNEQYRDMSGGITGASFGTLAYEKKVSELMQHVREGKNYPFLKGQAKEEAEGGAEEKLQKMLDANADILQAKKEMMDPGDFEKIQDIDEESEKIKAEIANQMRDTNDLDFSGRIELEKQNDKLREERIAIEAKYKEMGRI